MHLKLSFKSKDCQSIPKSSFILSLIRTSRTTSIIISQTMLRNGCSGRTMLTLWSASSLLPNWSTRPMVSLLLQRHPIVHRNTLPIMYKLQIYSLHEIIIITLHSFLVITSCPSTLPLSSTMPWCLLVLVSQKGAISLAGLSLIVLPDHLTGASGSSTTPWDAEKANILLGLLEKVDGGHQSFDNSLDTSSIS